MADSVHTQLVNAIIARLNSAITVAGGYNFDLSIPNGGGGAHGIKRDYQSGGASPWLTVQLWREDKGQDDMYDTHLAVTGDLHISGSLTLPADPDLSLDTHTQRLVDDIEKCLGIARQEDPVLNVAGVTDILTQGHTKMPWDEEDEFLEVIMELQVKFQHEIADPTQP